jgi:peroxiredoxin
VVAIAADAVEDMASLQPKLARIALLTDLDLSVATAWGLHAPGAENPEPGTFVVDRAGVVQWRRLEDKTGDWPTYAEVASALH